MGRLTRIKPPQHIQYLLSDSKLMWLLCCHLTLSVQVHGQVLEDVHVCRVGDGAHGGGAALVVDVSNCLCAYIQH